MAIKKKSGGKDSLKVRKDTKQDHPFMNGAASQLINLIIFMFDLVLMSIFSNITVALKKPNEKSTSAM